MGRKPTVKDGAHKRAKLNLSVDEMFARRLGAYAKFHRRDMSAVVVEACEALMRGFYCGQRASPATTAEGPALPSPGPRLAAEEAA